MQTGLSPHALIYDLVGLVDPQVSPDGHQTVFVRSVSSPDSLKPTSELWTLHPDGTGIHHIAQAGENPNTPRWSPDGQRIACVTRQDETSGVALLTPDAMQFFPLPTVPGELAWSSDGRRIAFVADYDPNNPDATPPNSEAAPKVRVVRRIDYKQENRGFLNDVRHALWLLDLEDGSIRRVTDDRTDHLAPAWSPDGTRIATKISHSNGMTSQLCLIDVESGVQVKVGKESGFISTWLWTPDGGAIVYSGDVEQSWQADWFHYTLATAETRRITDDLLVSIDGGFPTVALPAQPTWIDDERLLYHGFRRGQSGLFTLHIYTGTSEELISWSAVHAGFSVDAKRRFVAQIRTTPDAASEYVVTDLGSKATTAIYRPNSEQLAGKTSTDWKRITINRAGLDIDGWLLLPPKFDPTLQYPLILDIHGGPNAAHGPSFNPVQQALAGSGFPVLFTNPRGSTSYGRAFTQAVIGDWGGEDYADQMAFVDELCRRPYIDSERLGVYGYSYGGFMTSWIIGHTNRFKAAVIGAPVVDLASFYGTADIGHMFGPLQIGGTPWESPEAYKKHSPITYLHTATTPALVLHGEADDRVPIGQGEQCFMTLKQAGCVTEFVRYPGEAHAMLRTGLPAHRYDYLTRVVGWFEKYLSNRTAT